MAEDRYLQKARDRWKFDLVGTHEIAERFGLAHVETVHNWRRRYEGFPAPVARLRAGYVWLWWDVERWARRAGKKIVRSGGMK